MRNYLLATFASLCLFAGSAMAAPYIPDPSAVPKTGTFDKSPVGSTFTINSFGKFGTQYVNGFKIQPDHTAKLVFQYASANQPDNN